MSEATVFEFPFNLFLMERLEFVLICQDELEAKIMRIIEYDMVKQKENWQTRVAKAVEEKRTPPPEPKVYWVRLSYTQILARLYRFDSKKVGAKHPLSLSKTTLRLAINSLIKKTLIYTRSKPGEEFGAPLYTLNRPLIQEAMSQLPKDTFSFFLKGGSNSEGGGEVLIPNLPGSNLESGEVENSDIPPSDFEPGEVENSNLLLESITESSLDLEREIPVVPTFSQLEPVLPLSPLEDTSPVPETEEEREDEGPPTDKQVAVSLAASLQPTGGIKHTVLRDGVPVTAPSPVKWDVPACLHLFQMWRGGKELLTDRQIAQANTCAYRMVKNYTQAEVIAARTRMLTIDEYWCQRSIDICEVAGAIKEQLEKIEKAKVQGIRHAPPLIGPTEGSQRMAALRAHYTAKAEGGG